MHEHRHPRATEEALGTDGWLGTGDIGQLDAYGFLHITDRKMDLITTAGGKKVAPQVIEQLLQGDPLVSHALIVGEGRPYITALVTLNEEELAFWARGQELSGNHADLSQSAAVRERVAEIISRANEQLARPEQVKRFAVLPRDFSPESGEVTPTLKLKRRVCEQHFAAEVEALYDERLESLSPPPR